MDPLLRDRIPRMLHQGERMRIDADLRRAFNQFDFVRALADAFPDLDELPLAVGDAERALASVPTVPADMGRWRSDVEAALAPAADIAKSHVIHCVGHGHIDMNWMWSWPETVATTHDTFAAVLDLMRRHPQLTYSQSQGSVYAIVEEHYPEMFQEICARIAEGRWEVTAAHWVEGDKNLAHGEALVRHLLYTRRYCAEKFGLTPEDVPVDWEPDTFGHANTVPSILAQAAIKYYYSCRTGGGHGHRRLGEARPPLFYWQAPDGARVLVNRETTWYNSYVNIGQNYALPMVAFAKQTGLHHWLNVFGLGNHGGGPSREEVEYLLETQTWPVWPTIAMSTSKAYFEAVESEVERRGIELPVIDHELNFEFTGCYTSQSAIKRANRQGEAFCLEGEVLSAVRRQVLQSPSTGEEDRLAAAWRNVLFNQFHDILPGSGVAATREHAVALFQEVGAITGSIKRRVLDQLAGTVNTAALLPDTEWAREELAQAERFNDVFQGGPGDNAGSTGISNARGGGSHFRPILVFNPLPWVRNEIVEMTTHDLPFEPSRLVVRDEFGVHHKPLVVEARGWDWGHTRTTVLFKAMSVPALGYRTYLLCEGVPDAEPDPVTMPDQDVVQTPHLRIKFDRHHAGLAECTSLDYDREFAPTPLGRWSSTLELDRGMTSWVTGEFQSSAEKPLVATSFHISGFGANEGTGEPGGSTSIALGVQHLQVPGTKSTVRLVTLVQGTDSRVDFVADIDWREIGDHASGIPGLQVAFPWHGDKDDSVYETPFGTVRRAPLHDTDVPTLRFVGLSDAFGGMTIAQDSKYGHRLEEERLVMRVIRSSFDPDHAPEVGKSRLRYSVQFHRGEVDDAARVRFGAEINHPLLVVGARLQKSEGPVSASWLECQTERVLVTSMKGALDGNGIILRLNNLTDLDQEASVSIAEPLMRGLSHAEKVDLLERPIGEFAMLEGGTLRVAVAARSVVSVRLTP